MTPLSFIIIALAVLLFIIDVVLGFPYSCFRNDDKIVDNCPLPRKTPVMEFFGQELPFVYLLIGLPLLVASPGDGAFTLGLAALSFTACQLCKRTTRPSQGREAGHAASRP